MEFVPHARFRSHEETHESQRDLRRKKSLWSRPDGGTEFLLLQHWAGNCKAEVIVPAISLLTVLQTLPPIFLHKKRNRIIQCKARFWSPMIRLVVVACDNISVV